MSLLPGRILPADTPIGTVNADGTVTINHDYWLLLYNLCLQVLGTTGTLPVDSQALLTETADATDDGNDLRPQLADLERLSTLEDPQVTTVTADLAELQALGASLFEDPIVVRFTSQADGLVPASGGGTANFLRADGTWAVPAYPTVPVGANPTAVIGLTVVNGSAVTFMRSDAAPPIDQSITPTWSGPHIFSAAETRKQADSAFLSFYNTAGSTRTGYLQLNAAGTCYLNVEIAQALNFRTSNTDRISIGASGGVTVITTIGFNNTAPIAKPTVTGSKGGNAALASLLTALANYGLVTDSST